MRFIIYLIILLPILNSCTSGSTDKYTEYVLSKSDIDDVVSDMMKTGNFSNSVFINKISLKDGQQADAGLSFIMDINGAKFIVSAKHLLGPAVGFKDTVKTENIAKEVSAWQCTNLSSTDSIYAGLNDITVAKGDVLIFNSIINKNNFAYRSFKLSKMMIPVTMNGETDMAHAPGMFYLVAYEGRKEILIPLKLAGDYQEYYLFRKGKDFNFHGYSGGPILDEKGNVFAILSAGIDNNGEELIAGTKIRPLNLK